MEIVNKPVTEENINALAHARNLILHKYNVWPTIENVIKDIELPMVRDKKILIIGGTGSLGNELVKHWGNINKLMLFSRDENKHWKLQNKYRDMKLNFFLGDVRNKSRVIQCLCNFLPDIVIIASALKHINICEENIAECIQTNLSGTQNVVDAIEENIERLSNLNVVLLVSTDKACNPINVYGMCKSISERLIVEMTLRPKLSNIKFVNVRYGNVINSRGSIIPLLKHQCKISNELTLTAKDMTRFFMTLTESFNLIENTIVHSKSGDTWIPILKSIRISDLFEYFAKKYNKRIKEVGIRIGEKIHEELINITESLRAVREDNYYVIKPVYSKMYANSFIYNSSNNLIDSKELETYLESMSI